MTKIKALALETSIEHWKWLANPNRGDYSKEEIKNVLALLKKEFKNRNKKANKKAKRNRKRRR